MITLRLRVTGKRGFYSTGSHCPKDWCLLVAAADVCACRFSDSCKCRPSGSAGPVFHLVHAQQRSVAPSPLGVPLGLQQCRVAKYNHHTLLCGLIHDWLFFLLP